MGLKRKLFHKKPFFAEMVSFDHFLGFLFCFAGGKEKKVFRRIKTSVSLRAFDNVPTELRRTVIIGAKHGLF